MRLTLGLFAIGIATTFAACGGTPIETDGGSDAPHDAAPACRADGDCSDGLVCNGVESCRAGACVAGSAMHCDDGIACTNDACSESLAQCVFHVPDADGDGDGDASCLDTTGTPLGTDCDDHDARRFHGNAEQCDTAHVDEDCDATTLGGRDDDGDGFVSALCCDGTTCSDDCDDTRASANPDATEVCNLVDDDCDHMVDEGVSVAGFVDHDRDGYGDPSMVRTACGTAPGFSIDGTDCDDTRVSVHPGQPELCDGIDNDCDVATAIDANATSVTWYRDVDGDGFGTHDETTTSCMPPVGYALLGTDCDDTSAARSPASAELCNGIDDDCSGAADYVIAAGDLEDDDRDGVPDAMCHDPRGSDCDDRDPTSVPGGVEACDGRDDDCDGRVDENAIEVAFYRDADHDGFGSGGAVSVGCNAPSGYTRRGGDCDDTSDTRFPGALEACDAIDNDCDVAIDEGGYAASSCTQPDALTACVRGACTFLGCAAGHGDCTEAAGCETDLRVDAARCGSCASPCPGLSLCSAGVCTQECNPSSSCTPNLCEWGTTCSALATCGQVIRCGPLRVDNYPVASTPLEGPGGGTAFEDACPTGELPIGVEARVTDGTADFALTELALRCGAPSFTTGTVTIAASSRQPSASGEACCSSAAGASVMANCPEGTVVVGYDGSAHGAVVRTLSLRCAPLTVSGTSARASFALSLGTVTTTPVIGTTPGTPFAGASCAPGRVAQAMSGTTDASGLLLGSFGLRCGTPSLAVATTAPFAAADFGPGDVLRDCPAGQVPIGMTVGSTAPGTFYNGYLAHWAFQCGALALTPHAPTGWDVSIGPGTTLPTTGPLGVLGGTTLADTVLSCATNEVVVGVYGSHGYQIGLRCAAMIVTGDEASGFQVSYGAVHATALAGWRVGSAYGPIDCPPDTVASGWATASGEILDGVALRCAHPTLSP